MDLDCISGGSRSNRGMIRLFLREIKEFHREYEWLS
jgi:hypothetical protein